MNRGRARPSIVLFGIALLVGIATRVCGQPTRPQTPFLYIADPDAKDLARGRVSSPVFRHDGRYLLTASGRAGMLWNVKTGNLIRRFEGHRSIVQAVSFSPDERRVLTAAGNPDPFYLAGPWDFTARLWDVATGKQIGVLDGFDSFVVSAQFSPDGKQIMTVCNRDATPVLWDADTLERQFDLSGMQVITPQLTTIDRRIRSAVQFSPSGDWIVGVSTLEMRLWDAKTGELVWTVGGKGPVPNKHGEGAAHSHFTGRFYWVEFSPKGKLVLAACRGRSAEGPVTSGAVAFDPATGREVRSYGAEAGDPVDASFCFDGNCVMTATTDGTARLWETDSGRQIRQFTHPAPIREMVLSSDGTRMITRWKRATDDGSVDRVVVDASGVVQRKRGPNPWVASLWDVENGKEVRRIPGSGSYDTMVFSPDSKTIVMITPGERTELVDARTGKVIDKYE